jgi:carbon-monoxide dehydrogenase medium subunit
MNYYQPETVAEATTLLDDEVSPEIVAGGQSMMPMLRQGQVSPSALVDITGLDVLDGINVVNDTVQIGALVRYTDVLDHELCVELDLLRESISAIADTQIRNAGTVGGGVVHGDPAQDLPPALQCYEATVTAEPGGETYDLTDFYVDVCSTELPSTQLLTHVEFDHPPKEAGGSYQKHGRYGYSDAGIGALVVPGETGYDDVRIAYAAGGPSPQRVPPSIENFLEMGLSEQRISEAGDMLIDSLDLVGKTNENEAHLEHVFRVLLKRALTEAVDRSAGPAITTD